jgi:hypothetical protein
LSGRRTQDPTEKLALYEASVVRLESIRNGYIRRKPRFARGFGALIAMGFACFAFGGFAGLWGSICATFVGLTGYGMVGLRIRELKTEIDALRLDIQRMRRRTKLPAA